MLFIQPKPKATCSVFTRLLQVISIPSALQFAGKVKEIHFPVRQSLLDEPPAEMVELIMTDIIEFIHNRHSEAKLTEPAPSGPELEAILGCALRAPDHGLLRPWRYIVLEGKAREGLGHAWAEALAVDTPEAKPKVLDKARTSSLRAPMIIVAVTRVQNHPKVPAIEQQLSTGVGVGYLLLALQSKGYNGYWRTGPMAYHPRVKAYLALGPRESISGFLYVGTPKKVKPASPLPSLADHISYRDDN